MQCEPSESQRSYFRVRTRIGLRMRRIDPQERESLRRDILEDRAQPVESLDPDLARWLDRLERKLDRVLALLAPDAAAGAESGYTEVILSGGGLALEDEPGFARGDVVYLEIELPQAPAVRVRCLAEVASIAEGDGHRVALRFDVIREADRDRIVEYTLEIQRAELRSRREGVPA